MGRLDRSGGHARGRSSLCDGRLGSQCLASCCITCRWRQCDRRSRACRRGNFAAALAGYLLAHVLGVLKWRMVVNAAGAELDLAVSAQCYAGGLFGTLFLPSIVGGDVIRLAVGTAAKPAPRSRARGKCCRSISGCCGARRSRGYRPRASAGIAARIVAIDREREHCSRGLRRASCCSLSDFFSAARCFADDRSDSAAGWRDSSRVAQRFAAPACTCRRLARRNRDSVDISRSHRVARNRVRTTLPFRVWLFRVAVGKTRRTSAVDPRRHRSSRSRAGRAARAIWRRRTLRSWRPGSFGKASSLPAESSRAGSIRRRPTSWKRRKYRKTQCKIRTF